MSSFIQAHTLRLTPLSPIHLGTAEDYTPTNYVITDGVLHEFDHRALLALTDTQRQNLNQITQGAGTEQALLALEQFFFDSRETLALDAIHRVPVCSGVDKIYQQRIGRVAQQTSNGKTVINKLEIERMAYTLVDRQPFLPGSALKGAIRTAVLNFLNNGQPLPNEPLDPQARNHSGIQRDAASQLEKKLLNGKFHTDFFRLLHIKDAHPIGGINAQVLFALNRSREHKKTKKNLYQILECLLPGSRFQAQLSLQTPDFTDRDLPEKTPDLKELALACNNFYLPKLQDENKQLQQAGLLDDNWQQTINNLLEQIKPKLHKQHKAFLLRVGRHSGAESVTLDGVRRIKISPPGKSARWDSAPTTWWLAAEDKDATAAAKLIPFGWLLVEIDPAGDIEALAPLEERFSAPGQHLQQVCERLQQHKKEREQQMRQQAEMEKRAEAERARLERMTPEQRQIEALRSDFQQLQRFNITPEPGGEFAQKRQKLLNDALGWSDPAVRAEAANLIRETLTLLSWSARTKKDNNQKLRQLEASP